MKVIITGDISRPLPQHKNIEFFYDLLSQSIKQVSSLIDVECRSTPSFYLDFSEWLAKEMGHNHCDLDFEKGDFIIAFEPSREMLSYFKNNNIHFLAFNLAPYRYLDDLCFNIMDCYPFNKNYFTEIVSQFELQFSADYMRAVKNKTREVNLLQNKSVLLIGQSPIDRSVIGDDGQFKKLTSFEHEIKKIINERKTYFKPHPYYKEDDEAVKDMFNAEVLFEDSIYDLLSNPCIDTVISLSSSVGYEAFYFKKENFFLIDPIVYDTVIHTKDFIQPAFWAKVLQFDTVSAQGLPSIRHAPNMLRIGVGFWGYDLRGN